MTRERDFDELLRAWASEGADQAPERFVWAALDQIETTPQRGRWQRSVRRSIMRRQLAPQFLALAAVVIATATYIALSGPSETGPGPSPAPSPVASADPTPSATPSGSPTSAISARPVSPVATIDIGGMPWQLRASSDAIWASVGDQLVRIDPATNEVVQRIDVAGAGASCPDCMGGDAGSWTFVIDGRSAWVSFHIDGASMVRRIDLDDGRIVAEIPLEPSGGEDVAVAFGSVWVSVCHSSQVLRIDPTSNEVIGSVRVEADGQQGDCNAMHLGVGAGSVWTAFGGDSEGRVAYVVRIDPETLTTTTIHPRSTATCGQLAVTVDDLWVSTCPGKTGQSIVQIDPRTDSEVGSIRLGGYPGEPVIDGDLVWVPVVSLSTGSVSLVAIDRGAGAIVDVVDQGTTVRTRASSAAPAVAGFDSLWVNGAGGTLLRISRSDLVP